MLRKKNINIRNYFFLIYKTQKKHEKTRERGTRKKNRIGRHVVTRPQKLPEKLAKCRPESLRRAKQLPPRCRRGGAPWPPLRALQIRAE